MPKERTEYVKLMVERYHDTAYNPDGTETSYEACGNYLLLINAPEQYEVEPQMLEYAKKHPEATVRQMVEYFVQIVPPGLPPCASEWDDDDDDDNE